eukprot:10635034-Heterocapsa_arctica.AAC.1
MRLLITVSCNFTCASLRTASDTEHQLTIKLWLPKAQSMSWSMANARFLSVVLEAQLGQAAPEQQREQKADIICEDMNRAVMQKEVPGERTCAKAKASGAQITPDDIKNNCRRDTCLTCSARDINSGFNTN